MVERTAKMCGLGLLLYLTSTFIRSGKFDFSQGIVKEFGKTVSSGNYEYICYMFHKLS